MIIKCAYCGKSINRSPYKVKTTKNQFCNRDCSSNFYKIHYKGVPQKGRPKTGKNIKCKHCGKSFYVCSSELKRSNKQYCNKSNTGGQAGVRK